LVIARNCSIAKRCVEHCLKGRSKPNRANSGREPDVVPDAEGACLTGAKKSEGHRTEMDAAASDPAAATQTCTDKKQHQ